MATTHALPLRELMADKVMADVLAGHRGKRLAVLGGEVVRHELGDEFSFVLDAIARATRGKDGHYIIPDDLEAALRAESEAERIAAMPNPFDKATFNLTEQGRLYRDGPALYEHMKGRASGG